MADDTPAGWSGSPYRHTLDWQNPDFYDLEKVAAEAERVFDVCHSCRRCFNLCASFPRLFGLVDAGPTGEIDGVDRKDYGTVVDACTLCDLCFMTKCPYVPPHEWAIDFPHLMLRWRAAELKSGKVDRATREVTKTDRNGKLATLAAPVANWASACGNALTRPAMEAVAGIDRNAALPRFSYRTLTQQALDAPHVNEAAPGFGRKIVIYATCYGEYNQPEIGRAAQAVLAHNGVRTEFVYPGCCGMPQLEQGDIADVAGRAREIAAAFKPYIEDGYRVVALVPSCALMLKAEWPLILPQDEDVRRLSRNTSDISEYIVEIARKEGLTPGLRPVEGGVTLHLACHARAQNIGAKAAELLRLLPDTKLDVIERCSGHGGSWGIRKENFEIAIKLGKPVARAAANHGNRHVASECPLAATHIMQGIERIAGNGALPAQSHPIELFARAYGLVP
ncbi:MAG TPA: heterodisulfide reductase-related iron-sulfur binding cluster [Stellaceae bacterium]|nr:heterodisulfide reductase-related iron-sulfur binding cluster [Stellaceae bacterium]